jgi:hypothetical protein
MRGAIAGQNSSRPFLAEIERRNVSNLAQHDLQKAVILDSTASA